MSSDQSPRKSSMSDFQTMTQPFRRFFIQEPPPPSPAEKNEGLCQNGMRGVPLLGYSSTLKPHPYFFRRRSELPTPEELRRLKVCLKKRK